MRVAIVHERFTDLGGSERAVEQLHQIWPEAPIYAAVVDPAALPQGLHQADVRASALQSRYHGGSSYARLLPWLPGSLASLDLSEYDLVIASHHAFANRIRPPTATPVISYTYTPARWIWDAAMRRGEPGGLAGRVLLGGFAATQRGPDRRAAGRALQVVAISRAVRERIQQWWRRDAAVVAPPVDVTKYTPAAGGRRDDFFLVAGRLVPYKEPVVAVEAARQAGVRLVVVGEGRQRSAVERAAGPKTEVLGRVDDDTLRDLYRRARALVFPGEEDFGLVPVEAQACGTPVVARAVGGVLDTVIDGVTGTLYAGGRGDVDALAAALRAFDPSALDSKAIRAHAESFAPERFRARFAAACDEALAAT
jgi:glycosyltransferase involved in cell wall biosynthesis